jgi:hypothetical protein
MLSRVRVQNWLIIAGILSIVSSVGILVSISYFHLRECDAYAQNGGKEAIKDRQCDYPFQPLSGMPIVYGSFFAVQVITGTLVILYAKTQPRYSVERLGDLISSRVLLLLLLLAGSLASIFFFVVAGFMENQYYIDTRCPSTYIAKMSEDEQIREFCSLVQTIYGINLVENFVNLTLSLAWVIPAMIYFNQVRRLGYIQR